MHMGIVAKYSQQKTAGIIFAPRPAVAVPCKENFLKRFFTFLCTLFALHGFNPYRKFEIPVSQRRFQSRQRGCTKVMAQPVIAPDIWMLRKNNFE